MISVRKLIGTISIVLCCSVALAANEPLSTSTNNQTSADEQNHRAVEMTRLEEAINTADKNGNYKQAVSSAQECITYFGHIPEMPGPYFFCQYYLAKALASGKGIAQDKNRAFQMMDALAAKDPVGDGTLTLAEFYLDGTGTQPNAVKAAVLVDRVKHGSLATGLCNECDDFYNHLNSLKSRLRKELTPEERQQVKAIEKGTL